MRNQASATAKVIAAATIFLRAQSKDAILVSDEAAQLCAKFLSTLLRDRLLRRMASTPVLAWVCWALERATLTGIMTHYARRKCTIEREVLSRLREDSIGRVYILGAGFDTLCLRIAAMFPNVKFVELDHPATQAVKLRALANSALPQNLEFRAVDLATTATEQLFTLPQAASISRNRLVIAEGLLRYFARAQVERLLAGALGTHLSDAGSNVCIFSYMEQIDGLPAGFRPRSWLIDRWLALKKEPFLWSASAASLAEVVSYAGGRIERAIQITDFEGAASASTITGENLVIARSV